MDMNDTGIEVWELIFEKLESPTDVANCFRTCKAFRKLLKPKRKTFLMPEIFPIILKYLVAKKKDTDDSSEEESDDDDAEVQQDAGPNPILNLRLVCKSWEFGVDSYLQNLSCYDLDELPINNYNFDLLSLNKFENFIKKDFPPDSNPVITRRIHYSEQFNIPVRLRGPAVSRLRTAFTNLLELHGSNIWHATIDFLNVPDEINLKYGLYDFIQLSLKNMPNLKTLDLYFYQPIDTPFLDQLGVIQPLPTLEHLTSLGMRNVPAPLKKGMLLAYSHAQNISSFCVSWGEFHASDMTCINRDSQGEPSGMELILRSLASTLKPGEILGDET